MFCTRHSVLALILDFHSIDLFYRLRSPCVLYNRLIIHYPLPPRCPPCRKYMYPLLDLISRGKLRGREAPACLFRRETESSLVRSLRRFYALLPPPPLPLSALLCLSVKVPHSQLTHDTVPLAARSRNNVKRDVKARRAWSRETETKGTARHCVR